MGLKTLAAGDGTAHASWHLGGPDGAVVRVNVEVSSVVAECGGLDVQRSEAAVCDRALELMLTTERDPEGVWVRGELG